MQADLKVIAALGGFGMSAITALTAQNTRGVVGIFEVTPEFVGEQIDAVLSDLGADAVKTGMLAGVGIVRTVARKLREHGTENVVVDPVMVAKGGDRLLAADAVDALVSEVLPLARVVTPNLPEVQALTGSEISTLKEMKAAAIEIFRMGPRAVLVKGGHLDGDAVDLLFDGGRFEEYPAARIETENTHGTGCTYAAAIATLLAQGMGVPDAVGQAKAFVTDAIRFSIDFGGGHGPVDGHAPVERELERFRLIEELRCALDRLKAAKIGHLIPEVQSNLGAGLTRALGPEEVAAIPGRIVRLRDSIVTVADPAFGASRHIASIVLTMMRYDPSYRSAMNLRYSPGLVARCEQLGLAVRQFDRRKEPAEVKAREGSSLAWGVASVLDQEAQVPDAICDEGGMGKEPMIRILGRSPMEVVEKVLRIAGGTGGQGDKGTRGREHVKTMSF